MQCVRCEYNGGGGYFSALDGSVCETCANKDAKMQFASIVNLLFQVPYDKLRTEYKEAVDKAVAKHNLSMDEIQAEVNRITDEYIEHCRQDAKRVAELEMQGVYDDPDFPFRTSKAHIIGD